MSDPTSHRVIVTGRGGPEVLEFVEGPLPVPKPKEVRVRVQAAGVAYGDVMRRRGVLAPRVPFTPGYDVAGVVDALGSAVESWAPGAPVAAMMPRAGLGGYAEHVCIRADRLVSVPAGVEAATAVALGLNYITAYQLIHRFVPLVSGQRALVHGAAGGVGTALLEIGQRAGLVLYGTASAPKHDVVRARGATPIDYRSEDFVERMAELEPDGVDAVFDPIGGAHLRRSNQVLKRGGTVVAFGVSGDVERGLSAVAAGLGTTLSLACRRDGNRIRHYAITLSRGTSPAHCRDDWARLLRMHVAGELDPLVAQRIPLREAARAHELMDATGIAGKIVLVTEP